MKHALQRRHSTLQEMNEGLSAQNQVENEVYETSNVNNTPPATEAVMIEHELLERYSTHQHTLSSDEYEIIDSPMLHVTQEVSGPGVQPVTQELDEDEYIIMNVDSSSHIPQPQTEQYNVKPCAAYRLLDLSDQHAGVLN